jgi:2-dehydro-3-deoxygluconokinase
MTRIVCFGEIMLRLSAPDRERLLQSANLKATFGGAEANVAASLARFGHQVSLITALPDNAIGRAAIDQLRLPGVDTSRIRLGAGRMGLYFITPGAVQTPSEVLYDRAGSVFAETDPSQWDWDQLLTGADWLHLTGVTPAIGPKACEAALAAAAAAVRLGVKLSFDGNYRSRLWAAWDGDAAMVWRTLLGQASLAFVNDQDITLATGEDFSHTDLVSRRRYAARRAFELFPRLEAVACTHREMDGSDACTLSAMMFTRVSDAAAAPRRLNNMVDRIGGGDAFAAGVLHGVISGMEAQGSIEFGLAASVLKHAIPGDFNPSTAADVVAAIGLAGQDVRR